MAAPRDPAAAQRSQNRGEVGALAEDSVTLRDESNDEGSRWLIALIDDHGDLVLRGHDVGPGVASFFGTGHDYEWNHTIRTAEFAKLREALGASGHEAVLSLIARWCREHGAHELEPTLEDHGVEIERWSWIGTDWD